MEDCPLCEGHGGAADEHEAFSPRGGGSGRENTKWIGTNHKPHSPPPCGAGEEAAELGQEGGRGMGKVNLFNIWLCL